MNNEFSTPSSEFLGIRNEFPRLQYRYSVYSIHNLHNVKNKFFHKNVDNILQKRNRIHGSNGYVFCQFLSIHSMYENKKTGEK